MRIFKFLKRKKVNRTPNSKIETEVLYSSNSNGQKKMIEGVELPKKWKNLSPNELKNQARKTIFELTKNANSDIKAKALGFNDAEHLIKLCFEFILKY